jgi:hypothetical protein
MTDLPPEMRVQSLEELESHLIQIRKGLRERNTTGCVIQSEPLFRGHADSRWRLETTLERFIPDEQITVNRYNSYLARAKPTVETITDRKWRLSRGLRLSHGALVDEPPSIEFMAYVRHHGYPSPLLDWSRSPYVALYFAFSKARNNQDTAVFVFIKAPEGVRSGSLRDPQICELSRLSTTHVRHISQQSRYTICVRNIEGDEWAYCSHELAMEPKDASQNSLQKITLPGSLRLEVLDKLDHMNINGYTLFNSEDGLMESLAFREIEALESRQRGEI